MITMNHRSKFDNHDECNSESSSVNEKATDDRRSGKAALDEMASKKAAAKAKRGRKPVDEDDVTLTFPQHVSWVQYIQVLTIWNSLLTPRFIPLLLLKLMEILENESLSEIISWLPHGQAFLLINKRKFAKDVLGQYFKRSKFSSFTRKLNRWGFQRISRGPDTGAYFHPLFQRNNLRLCLQMTSNGTKATNEYYPNRTQDDLQPTCEAKAPNRAADEGKSNGVFASAPLSSSVSAHAEATSFNLLPVRNIDKTRSSENIEPGATGPNVAKSPGSGGFSTPTAAFVDSFSPRSLEEQFLRLQKQHTSNGCGDAGPRLLNRAGSSNLSLSTPSVVHPREATLLHLRQLEARSRAQHPFMATMGANSWAGPGLGLVHHLGNAVAPLSTPNLAYLLQLRQMGEARQRLPPQIQLQLAQASLAAAQASEFASPRLPPMHNMPTTPPPALFPRSTDQIREPDAANKSSVIVKTLASEHCFFPSMELRKDSNKAKERSLRGCEATRKGRSS